MNDTQWRRLNRSYNVCRGVKNTAGYIDMLERSSVFTEGARLCGEDWIFQQDNVAIYIVRRSKDLFLSYSNTRILT